MDYPIHFAGQLKQHLRSLRKARRMTQAHLARALGTTQSRVAHIEANPSAVSFDQLFQILSALGVDVVLRDRSSSQADKPGKPSGDVPSAHKSTGDDW
jgi:HTH-type transcriptional regulator/antitoxin HipB